MSRFVDFINTLAKDTALGVKGYFKSRLKIMAIVFLVLLIGLISIESPIPILLAFIIALIDIVPLLGAGIIMIPWGIISYVWGNAELGKGIIILYVILTILKQFIEPKILGKEIGIRPLYTFLATVLGSVIFGPIGLILGPIIAILIKSIVKSRDHLEGK